MITRVRFLSLFGTLALLLLSSNSSAEELNLTSYNELLSRLEQLESQQLQNMQQATHTVRSNCGGGCECSNCCRCGGWYGLFENVIVKPYFSNDPAFYLADSQIVTELEEVPFEWDLAYSPRVELGYLCDCGGLGWRARYWYFDHEATANGAAGPNKTAGVNQVVVDG